MLYTIVFIPTSRENLFMPYEQVPEQDNVLLFLNNANNTIIIIIYPKCDLLLYHKDVWLSMKSLLWLQ